MTEKRNARRELGPDFPSQISAPGDLSRDNLNSGIDEKPTHDVLPMVALPDFPACFAAAGAVSAQGGDNKVTIFFIQVALLITVGRLLGELLQRMGQPPVMGQIIGGVLLGPSVFGALAPDLQHTLFP